MYMILLLSFMKPNYIKYAFKYGMFSVNFQIMYTQILFRSIWRGPSTRIYFKHSSCGRGSFSLYVDIFLCKFFQINWHKKTCKLKKMEYILQKFSIKYQISDFYVAALHLSDLKMMQHIILNVYMYK